MTSAFPPALALALLLSAPAATAEILDSRPGGMSLRQQVVVPVAPAVAWQALIDVDSWWPRDHTWFPGSKLSIEPRAGGCFCEIAGERQARHMEVGFVDAPGTLRLLGGLGPLQGMGLYGSLEFTLEAVSEGTRITMAYVVGGYTTADLPKFAPVVDRVQGVQLAALAQRLKAK